jgi:hypothetical protein
VNRFVRKIRLKIRFVENKLKSTLQNIPLTHYKKFSKKIPLAQIVTVNKTVAQ